jgi:hypothetical protein
VNNQQAKRKGDALCQRLRKSKSQVGKLSLPPVPTTAQPTDNAQACIARHKCITDRDLRPPNGFIEFEIMYVDRSLVLLEIMRCSDTNTTSVIQLFSTRQYPSGRTFKIPFRRAPV